MSIFGTDKGAKKAADLQKGVLQRWESLVAPTRDELYYDIPEYGAPVDYNPLTDSYEAAPDTLMSGIEVDPQALLGQEESMDYLSEVLGAEGLSDMDKAALYEIINEQAQTSRGSQDAITQDFEQRMGGVAGSGLEAVLRAVANQEAATTGAQQGMDLASIAAARKLDVSSRLGDLSGEVRGQDYDEQAKEALAQDLIEQFNTQGRNRTNTANTAIENAANLYNVGQEQAAADANVQVAQQQAGMDPNITRELFSNEVAKLGGVSGATGNVANALVAKDAAKNAIMGNVMSTVGTVAGGIAGIPGGPAGIAMGAKAGGSLGGGGSPAPLPAAETGAELFKPGQDSFWSDVNLKENIEPVSDMEAEEILNGLSAYKYNYKDPSMGEGTQIGPMAQELEQTAPGMVSDHPEGKSIDYDMNTFAALLGHINDKLNKMGS